MSEEEKYPENFYRGISSKGFIASDGHPDIQAFTFDEPPRGDSYREMSINWNDSDESLEVLLNQKKTNGSIQFVGGAINIDLAEIRRILSPFIVDKRFDYERRPCEGNIFHGNLLLKQGGNKTENKRLDSMIRNFLALLGTHKSIIPNTNIEEKDQNPSIKSK